MRYLSTVLALVVLSAPVRALEVGDQPTELRTGLGIATAGTNSGGLVNVELRFPLDERVFQIGARTGLLATGAFTVAPVLATFTFKWREVGGSRLHAYIGAEGGLMVGSDVLLYAGLNPGLDIPLDADIDLNLQSQFGALGGAFYVAPQVNLIVPL